MSLDYLVQYIKEMIEECQSDIDCTTLAVREKTYTDEEIQQIRVHVTKMQTGLSQTTPRIEIRGMTLI